MEKEERVAPAIESTSRVKAGGMRQGDQRTTTRKRENKDLHNNAQQRINFKTKFEAPQRLLNLFIVKDS